jgi:DNA replication and repair protein RecF
MFVANLRLVHFRSYRESSVSFTPGLNVIVGENASGKTNLLEGAFFALRATSPRTRREDKLITWGEGFTRVVVELGGARAVAAGAAATEGGAPRATDGAHTVEVGYAPRQGKRVRFDGVEVASLDELRRRTQVFIFVPESLLLIKGSPARRRAHLDAFVAALDPGYEAALREMNGALRQRNAQLARVREGAAPATLDPWDVQLVRTAVELAGRRHAAVARLSAHFERVAGRLAPEGACWTLTLVSQLDAIGSDEEAYAAALRARRGRDTQRGLTLVGPHRDDIVFAEIGEAPGTGDPTAGDQTTADLSSDDRTAAELDPDAPAAAGRTGPPTGGPFSAGGRDLRLYGSQGEQRTAVLALLLAEQAFAKEETGELGTLFLDDVMSELDDARRRRLVAMLMSSGQALVTTTNRHYFTDDELAAATVVELPLARAGGARAAEEASVDG